MFRRTVPHSSGSYNNYYFTCMVICTVAHAPNCQLCITIFNYNFFRRNFFACRQPLASSDRLLSVESSGWQII